MEITSAGTVLNLNGGNPTPFAMSFDLTGGTLITAGCDTALMNAQVSAFSASVDGVAIGEPTAFLANLTISPYPNCSGTSYGQMVANPTGWLTLESNAPLFGAAGTFYGSIATYYINAATYVTGVPVPDPGTLLLWLVAIGAVLARFVPALVLRFFGLMTAIA